MVGSWASQVVPEHGALTELVDHADVSGSTEVVEHDTAAMLTGPVTVTTSFIAEAELLRLAGGFAPHALAMDDYWLLVNVTKIAPVVKIDQPTVFYRVHLGATSRTTRLALPFLSSAVALRLGGGLVPLSQGLAPGSTGPLHRHLLQELVGSSEFDDRSIRAVTRRLAHILWRHGTDGILAKATVKRRAPWLARAAGAAKNVRRSVSRSGAGR